MSAEGVPTISIDTQWLTLIDKQTKYYEDLRDQGLVAKAFQALEEEPDDYGVGLQHDESIKDLRDILQLEPPDPEDATLQVIPLLDKNEDEQHEAICLSFQWRTHAPGAEALSLRQVVLVIAERCLGDSYELYHNFSARDLQVVYNMLDELSIARAAGEIPDLSSDLTFIGDDVDGYNPGAQ